MIVLLLQQFYQSLDVLSRAHQLTASIDDDFQLRIAPPSPNPYIHPPFLFQNTGSSERAPHSAKSQTTSCM